MNALTRLRDVWKQVLLSQGGTVLLQKHMDLHTAEELERIVISQARGEHDLKAGGEWWPEKQFRPRVHTISRAYLVPGGRFFLNLIERAAVVYVDLEADDFIWRELIPPSPDGLQNFTISFEHIVDAPILTLHVAISIERRLPSFSNSSDEGSTSDEDYLPSVQEASIWRVYPQFDSQGIICGLQANRLSQFRHSQEGVEAPVVKSIKLQGDHLVLAQKFTDSSLCSVIRWAAVDGLKINVPRKVVSHACCHVRCL